MFTSPGQLATVWERRATASNWPQPRIAGCYVDISGCQNKHHARGFLCVPLDVEQRLRPSATCETVGISDHSESVLIRLTHPMTLAP